MEKLSYMQLVEKKAILDKEIGELIKQNIFSSFCDLENKDELDKLIMEANTNWESNLIKKESYFEADEERAMTIIFEEILEEEKEFENYGFIVNPQQPVSKYIQTIDLKLLSNYENLDNKNKWITSDFVIELKTYIWNKDKNIKTMFYRPVLAIEIDGDSHHVKNAWKKGCPDEKKYNLIKQHINDKYKEAVFKKIGCSFMRIQNEDIGTLLKNKKYIDCGKDMWKDDIVNKIKESYYYINTVDTWKHGSFEEHKIK